MNYHDEIRKLTGRPKATRKAFLDVQNALVNLWLGFDGNEAKVILSAFKVGLDYGRKFRRKASPKKS
jgi:hypothetical protein